MAKSESRGSALRKLPAANPLFSIQFKFWFDIFTTAAASLDSDAVCQVDGLFYLFEIYGPIIYCCARAQCNGCVSNVHALNMFA